MKDNIQLNPTQVKTESNLIHLKQTIFNFEIALANRTKDDLGQLISKSFKEFGSSGNIYTKQDYMRTIGASAKKYDYQILDFHLEKLDENIALATYKSKSGNNTALRSSIWKLEDGNWKMFFHQGTRIDKQ